MGPGIKVMSTKTLPPLPGVSKEDESETVQELLPLHKIIMWDDAVTTMEFVVRMLIHVFGKDPQTAEALMFEVHTNGSSIVDALPLERAEFKVERVHQAAFLEEFPFKCTIESA